MEENNNLINNSLLVVWNTIMTVTEGYKKMHKLL
jgi:hypothetical protein